MSDNHGSLQDRLAFQEEAAVDKLPRQEFFQLITWVKTRFEDEWDRQFEDVKEGRLEKLAQEALAEYHAGRTVPFGMR